MNLVLALALLGASATAIWAGIADPEGGVVEGLRRSLNSEPGVKRTSVTGAAFIANALAVNSAGGVSGAGGVTASYTGGASGARGAVLSEAETWLGAPYAWGGNTRAGVDCSGFTVAVYKTVGVTLPRVSIMQGLAGRAVTEATAQPGDLVLFGLPIHHVGIYLGGGEMIHAPKPGGVVRHEAVWHSEPITWRNVLDSATTTAKPAKRRRKGAGSGVVKT